MNAALVKLLGKRFIGLFWVGAIMGAAYFWGPTKENFAALANSLALIYGMYVGGQSLTDHKAASANVANKP